VFLSWTDNSDTSAVFLVVLNVFVLHIMATDLMKVEGSDVKNKKEIEDGTVRLDMSNRDPEDINGHLKVRCTGDSRGDPH